MSDIVERLTALSEEYRDHDPDVVAFTAEAAAELTRLRAENERTKALLARVTDDVARYNDEARKARADLAAAQEREQRMREALERIEQWGRAYPLSVFPEPDFDKARKALEAAGLTLDAVSASNMRHVVEGVSEIARAALGEPQ